MAKGESIEKGIESKIKDISLLYENEDFFIEASKNDKASYAIDKASNIRIIKLENAEIISDRKKVYVPKTCYITPYIECENVAKKRKEIYIDGNNTLPILIDEILRKEPDTWNVRRILSHAKEDRGFILEEATNIRKLKEKTKGYSDLVLLSEVHPISPLTGYELGGVLYNKDVCEGLSTPVRIKADRADFGFYSQNCAKISDSKTENLRKYKDGILTLEDVCLEISGLNIKSKPKFVIDFAPIIIFPLVGGLLGGLVYFFYKLTSGKDFWVGAKSTALAALALSSVYTISKSVKDSRRIKRESIESLMQTSFYGKLKDMRSEEKVNFKDFCKEFCFGPGQE